MLRERPPIEVRGPPFDAFTAANEGPLEGPLGGPSLKAGSVESGRRGIFRSGRPFGGPHGGPQSFLKDHSSLAAQGPAAPCSSSSCCSSSCCSSSGEGVFGNDWRRGHMQATRKFVRSSACPCSGCSSIGCSTLDGEQQQQQAKSSSSPDRVRGPQPAAHKARASPGLCRGAPRRAPQTCSADRVQTKERGPKSTAETFDPRGPLSLGGPRSHSTLPRSSSMSESAFIWPGRDAAQPGAATAAATAAVAAAAAAASGHSEQLRRELLRVRMQQEALKQEKKALEARLTGAAADRPPSAAEAAAARKPRQQQQQQQEQQQHKKLSRSMSYYALPPLPKNRGGLPQAPASPGRGPSNQASCCGCSRQETKTHAAAAAVKSGGVIDAPLFPSALSSSVNSTALGSTAEGSSAAGELLPPTGEGPPTSGGPPPGEKLSSGAATGDWPTRWGPLNSCPAAAAAAAAADSIIKQQQQQQQGYEGAARPLKGRSPPSGASAAQAPQQQEQQQQQQQQAPHEVTESVDTPRQLMLQLSQVVSACSCTAAERLQLQRLLQRLQAFHTQQQQQQHMQQQQQQHMLQQQQQQATKPIGLVSSATGAQANVSFSGALQSPRRGEGGPHLGAPTEKHVVVVAVHGTPRVDESLQSAVKEREAPHTHAWQAGAPNQAGGPPNHTWGPPSHEPAVARCGWAPHSVNGALPSCLHAAAATAAAAATPAGGCWCSSRERDKLAACCQPPAASRLPGAPDRSMHFTCGAPACCWGPPATAAACGCCAGSAACSLPHQGPPKPEVALAEHHAGGPQRQEPHQGPHQGPFACCSHSFKGRQLLLQQQQSLALQHTSSSCKACCCCCCGEAAFVTDGGPPRGPSNCCFLENLKVPEAPQRGPPRCMQKGVEGSALLGDWGPLAAPTEGPVDAYKLQQQQQQQHQQQQQQLQEAPLYCPIPRDLLRLHYRASSSAADALCASSSSSNSNSNSTHVVGPLGQRIAAIAAPVKEVLAKEALSARSRSFLLRLLLRASGTASRQRLESQAPAASAATSAAVPASSNWGQTQTGSSSCCSGTGFCCNSTSHSSGCSSSVGPRNRCCRSLSSEVPLAPPRLGLPTPPGRQQLQQKQQQQQQQQQQQAARCASSLVRQRPPGVPALSLKRLRPTA
ncbi:hypothetical protein Esti_005696 [Eimeria stiedai]